ncbi:muconolactone Delta-isomerase family protein [Streptomyces sp. NPDC094466]|uniref:muconolactone Delta-isomerase family protein n=1 Tax=Streptomyces sp. NPDC094466 TaxID=3366065 RepID=UPI00381116E5
MSAGPPRHHLPTHQDLEGIYRPGLRPQAGADRELWRAADPTELHTNISSLPVWPWMDVTVHALADHPVAPGPTA